MEPVSHYQIETEYGNTIPSMVDRTNDKMSTPITSASEDGKRYQVGLKPWIQEAVSSCGSLDFPSPTRSALRGYRLCADFRLALSSE
jgi:hypothetical protein